MKVSAEEPGVSAVVESAGGSGVKVHCLLLDLCSYWCVWDVSGLIAKVLQGISWCGADPQALQRGALGSGG